MQHSLDTVFRQIYRPLCMYAMHYLGPDIQRAEDVVQDVFVRLYERQRDESAATTGMTRSFFYSCVRNACIDQLRRQQPVSHDIEPQDLESTISDEEAIDRSEVEARLWEAINALPPRCREILLMSKRDGMTYGEIARRLDISEKTVEHQMAKALKRLRGERSSILYVMSLF